jgi:hypothetical protein
MGCRNTRVSRGWFAFERHNGPEGKIAFSWLYNSYDNVFENIIATWREVNTDSTSQRGGPLGQDHMSHRDPTYNKCSNSALYGSISYLTANSASRDPAYLSTLWTSQYADCLYLENVVSYNEPGAYPKTRTYALYPLSITEAGGPSQGNLNATRLSLIGGNTGTGGNFINNQWSVTASEIVSTVAGASNIWNGAGSRGARVCKRYFNGVLTSTPLWPWPMNQRIIDAMRTAGRMPVDVTKTMEKIFGPIPSTCRAGSNTSTASKVAAPGNLSLK